MREPSQWREAASKPRRGWYAYRVVDAATLPSWAVEVALTIERPADPHPEGSALENEEATRPWPASEEPEGSSRAVMRSPLSESSSHGGPGGPAQQPGPPDPLQGRAQAQAIVLLRASGRANWLAGIAEVAAEVETAAGVRPADDADTGMESETGARSRLRMGPSLSGLEPIPPAVAQAQLGAAGARGLPAPLRRWRPASGAAHLSWQASVGSVLTCDGPCGVSARRGSRAVVRAAGATLPRGAVPGAQGRRAGRTGAPGGLVLGRPSPWPGREAKRRRSVAHGMGCSRPPRPARPPPRPSRRPSAGCARGGGPRGFRSAGGGPVRDLSGRRRSVSPGSICRVLAVAGSDPLRVRRPCTTTPDQAVDSGMHSYMEDSMVKRM